MHATCSFVYVLSQSIFSRHALQSNADLLKHIHIPEHPKQHPSIEFKMHDQELTKQQKIPPANNLQSEQHTLQQLSISDSSDKFISLCTIGACDCVGSSISVIILIDTVLTSGFFKTIGELISIVL